ncbi:ABC transporter substrate-binding protein [Microlunatus speluncae]|uniref:ABC transporter substrate-binding protein n=1 Tax=Microlunatus speluncae TaxID=2594267 RepID=UPI0012664E8E|nr:sugar ABC transporter substrate-binding protein [Microlunatus speluncae]
MNATTRISRRTFVGAGGAAAAGLLAGCSGSGGGGGGGGSKSMTFLNDSDIKDNPFGKAIEAFQQQSGISVEVQPVPSDYDTKFRTVLSGGKPPDLIKINDDYVRGMSATGALLDLAPLIERDKLDVSHFPENLLNFPKQADGRHTAWVIAHSPRLIYYNVDMFKAAGVDLPPTTWSADGWTWDDFLATAKALTVPGERFGGLIYLDTGYEQTWAINNGSPTGIFAADGSTFTLAEPQAAEALQWATDLTCTHKVQPAWGDLQSTNADLQLFAQGKLGMMFSQFSTLPYTSQNAKGFTFDVAPPPAGPAGQLTESSVVTYSIPAKAENPDAAWELLKFLTSEEGGTFFVEGNMWLSMDDRPLAKLAEPPAHVGLFVDAVDHSTLPNQTQNTLGARQIYRPMLDEVYNCNAKAADVLTAAKPRVDESLTKPG